MSRGIVDLHDWRLFRQVEGLYPAGPRVIAEMLIELGITTLSRTEIDLIVDRYVSFFGVRKARK